ncbi:helix-turn-helix domain-containing protein [Pseudogracilibacillus sp. SO30301A]|uniref:helix-turn-helix domain-containing protein n=1 Tax=Pseudogracilibacillus sp. SO30301A TaxID=3098291 RepID=UPI00300DCEAE
MFRCLFRFQIFIPPHLIRISVKHLIHYNIRLNVKSTTRERFEIKKVKLQLNQLLHRHNMTLTQLHVKTGIRLAALSELANGKRQRIQFEHLDKIVDALDIKDMNDLFRIENDED